LLKTEIVPVGVELLLLLLRLTGQTVAFTRVPNGTEDPVVGELEKRSTCDASGVMVIACEVVLERNVESPP